MSDAGKPAGIGQQTPADGASDFNSISFMFEQKLSKCRTALPVVVMGIQSSDTVQAVGDLKIDVMPLVNQLDGAGTAVPHGTIFGVSFSRLQGGTNAIICDPQVGDKGLMVMSDRDISAVKATKAQANPGSYRRFDLADGCYVGCFLNGIPTQYIQFLSNGMKWLDLNGNTIQTGPTGVTIGDNNGNSIIMGPDGITINGVLFDQSSNISGAGTVMASGEGTFNGHTVGEHTHGGVQTGSGTTSPPTG